MNMRPLVQMYNNGAQKMLKTYVVIVLSVGHFRPFWADSLSLSLKDDRSAHAFGF